MKLKKYLIVVDDIDKSKQFYCSLFGLELITDNNGNINQGTAFCIEPFASRGANEEEYDYWNDHYNHIGNIEYLENVKNRAHQSSYNN